MNSTHTRPTVNGNRRQNPAKLAEYRARTEAAKARVSIFAAWVALGLPKPPSRDGVYDAPWANNHGSLSIFKGGTAWKDHSSGEGGSVVDFIARALSCDAREAIARLLDMAGMSDPAAPRRAWPVAKPPPPPASPEPPRTSKPPPPLRPPTVAELNALRIQRGLGPSWVGLDIMAQRGMLCASSWREEGANHPCFIITDPLRAVALRRRMDGEYWASFDAESKTWIPGSGGKSKTWVGHEGAKKVHPIGLSLLRGELFDAPSVFVVEGSPDAWALFSLLWDAVACSRVMRAFAVVVMADSGCDFTEEHADALRGRHVRIIPQVDRNAKPEAEKDAGFDAGEKWRRQLVAIGATVSVFRLRGQGYNFLPEKGKDLCDAAARAFSELPPHGDEDEEPKALTLSRAIVHGMPRFSVNGLRIQNGCYKSEIAANR